MDGTMSPHISIDRLIPGRTVDLRRQTFPIVRLADFSGPAPLFTMQVVIAMVCFTLATGCTLPGSYDPAAVPLWSAARYGRQQDLEAALAQGINVNARDDLGKTALHWAAQYGHDKAADTLLAHGANVSARSRSGYTPLHLAVQGLHGDMVKTLLEHGADVNARENGGWTPLHRLAAVGEVDMRARTVEQHLELTRLLLDHGADLRAADENGFTPLTYAALHHHLDVMTLLLDRGADTKAQLDDTLNVAVSTADADTVRLLLNRGASVL